MSHLIKHTDTVESLLEAFGTPTRFRILSLIADEPRYLSEISRMLNIGQQSIIRHMKKLVNLGIVTLYKQKAHQSRLPRHYYRLNPDFQFTIQLNSTGIIFQYRTPKARTQKPFMITFPHSNKLKNQYQEIAKVRNPFQKLLALKRFRASLSILETSVNDYRQTYREKLLD